MKIGFMMVPGMLLAAFALSSCGECSCMNGNKDYLRDVPVTRSQRFE